MTVWIYVDTSKQVGDKDHLKVFESEDAANAWFVSAIRKAWRLNIRCCPNFWDAQHCKLRHMRFQEKVAGLVDPLPSRGSRP